MKAFLKNYRQSPRKVRLIAGAVKGKRVLDAEIALAHMPKRAAEPMQKLIHSAAANAAVQGADIATLVVKNVEVNKGVVMKRWMPRAQGRSTPIHKHSSHVSVTLAEAPAPKAKKARSKKLEASS